MSKCLAVCKNEVILKNGYLWLLLCTQCPFFIFNLSAEWVSTGLITSMLKLSPYWQ